MLVNMFEHIAKTWSELLGGEDPELIEGDVFKIVVKVSEF